MLFKRVGGPALTLPSSGSFTVWQPLGEYVGFMLSLCLGKVLFYVFCLFLSICMKGNMCTLLRFKFNMQSGLPKLGGAIIFTSWNVCGLLIAEIHIRFQLSFFPLLLVTKSECCQTSV